MGTRGFLFWVGVFFIPLTAWAGREFDASSGALSQPSILFGSALANGDRVTNSQEVGKVFVESGNVDATDPDLKVARCVLKKLGLPLPKSRNGVYWAKWGDGTPSSLVLGLTVRWTGLGGHLLHYTFLHSDFKGLRDGDAGAFLDFLVTVYHEVKGHNLHNRNHDTPEETRAFETDYELPVRTAAASANLPHLQKTCN